MENSILKDLFYNGIKVVTTKQLAELYEVDEINIQKNYHINKSEFIEDKDYFLLKGSALKEFKNYYALKGIVHKLASKLYLLSDSGALKHSHYIKSICKNSMNKLLEYFNIPDNLILANAIQTKEYKILDILKIILKDICEIIPQYQLDQYRIDYYIPKYKIAIECDEHNHIDRDSKYEREREKYIIKKLECTLIRFNPDENNFDINKLINRILKLIIINMKISS